MTFATRRWTAAVAVAVMAVVTSCSDDQETAMPATSESDELSDGTAEENLEAMQSLFRRAMETAAPGAVERPEEEPARQEDCEAPLEGQEFYNWSLIFDVPEGSTGDSVLPQLTDFFENEGFHLSAGADSEEAELLIGRTDTVGFNLAGSHTSSRVALRGASACGPPGRPAT